MIRFLIWDAGGTLFDTYPAVVTAFGLALRDYGKDAPPGHVAALARESLAHCTATLAAEFGLDRDDLERRFRGHYAQVPPSEQPPFPGVTELCAYVCAIGGNFLFTHRARASAQALLDAHGLTRYFADLLTTEDGYPRKPDPAGLRALIHRHRLPIAQVLAVGDREIDIVAGQAAGVRTAFFGRPPSSAHPDYAFTHYAELHRWLGRGDAFPNAEFTG